MTSGAEADEARVVAWLRANLGGEVVEIRRQARWRPAWFVDLYQDRRTLPLYVRGERRDMPPIFPLEHEMRMQQVLAAHGIPVPQVHGFCDRPRAIVMDRARGSLDFSGSSDDERRSVMEDYVQILVRMHRLDVRAFARAAIEPPADSDAASIGIRAYERAYRSSKRRPDPFMEFCLQWLVRHRPRHRVRPAAVVWDSGQFLHHDGRVAALLDLELAHIGDPLMDLAGLRMRDTVIGYGELRALYRRYEELTGEGVDLAVVETHHFAFAITPQLALHGALAEPMADTDLMTYMLWCSESNLYALEALAGFVGVELQEVDAPALQTTPVAVAYRHLVQGLRAMEAADELGAYQLRTAFRLARHLERFAEIGPRVVEQDLDDLGALLGRRPATWEEGEADLERFVLEADPGSDSDLVQLFHRRLHRQRMLLGPAGSAMARHVPLQPIR